MDTGPCSQPIAGLYRAVSSKAFFAIIHFFCHSQSEAIIFSSLYPTLLKPVALSAIYLAASAQAVITFYGDKGPSGDSVTCTTNYDALDQDLADVVSAIYPYAAGEDSTKFRFEDPLICGDDLARSIEFTCQGFQGTATCWTGSETTTSNNARRSSHAQPLNREFLSSPSLFKRDGAECSKYTGQCWNKYQSTNGYCSAGYKKDIEEVSGFSADIWCVKNCTDAEMDQCRIEACGDKRKFCEKDPKPGSDFQKALFQCRDNPV